MTKNNLPLEFDGSIEDAVEIITVFGNSFDEMLFGQNMYGEHITMSICEDKMTVMTYQNNGWVRENIYYNDYTAEELYHK